MTPRKLRPSFALVAALTLVGGGLFGMIGAFLALPIYTTISVEVRELLVRRLNKKNLPVSTEAYINADISVIAAPKTVDEKKEESADPTDEKAE